MRDALAIVHTPDTGAPPCGFCGSQRRIGSSSACALCGYRNTPPAPPVVDDDRVVFIVDADPTPYAAKFGVAGDRRVFTTWAAASAHAARYDLAVYTTCVSRAEVES